MGEWGPAKVLSQLQGCWVAPSKNTNPSHVIKWERPHFCPQF